jgi:hypothetical protein
MLDSQLRPSDGYDVARRTWPDHDILPKRAIGRRLRMPMSPGTRLCQHGVIGVNLLESSSWRPNTRVINEFIN